MIPKVLVGAPVCDKYEYCLDDFLKGIESLDYSNYDLLLVDNSKTDEYYNKLKSMGLNVHRIEYRESARDRMVDSRNVLRQYAIANNYEYLLSLDADIVLQPDVLKNLIFHKKDIISTVYFRELTNKDGQTKIFPLILEVDKNNPDIIRPVQDIVTHRLVKIAMCGLGCVLINRKVFEKIKFRYNTGFDDDAFCLDAREQGFSIFADTSIICKHLFLKRPWNWDNYEIVKK